MHLYLFALIVYAGKGSRRPTRNRHAGESASVASRRRARRSSPRETVVAHLVMRRMTRRPCDAWRRRTAPSGRAAADGRRILRFRASSTDDVVSRFVAAQRERMRAGSFARAVGASPDLVGTIASSTVTGVEPHGSVFVPALASVVGRDRGRHSGSLWTLASSSRVGFEDDGVLRGEPRGRRGAPGVAYSLGRTLYLSVTNRSNAASILDTRGPGFQMPESSGSSSSPTTPRTHLRRARRRRRRVLRRHRHRRHGRERPRRGVRRRRRTPPPPRCPRRRRPKVRADFSRHGVPFRVHTNGLHPPSVVAASRTPPSTASPSRSPPQTRDSTTR